MATSTSFLVPFQLTSQGTVATTSDPDTVSSQRVKAIISTSPNQRVMLADYGIPLASYLFSPDIPESIDRITTDIITAMQKYEPVITILEVKPIINEAAIGVQDIQVEFTQSTDQAFTPTLTATVLVGGTVVGN